MLKALLIIIIVFVLFIAYRIYSFLRATNAPILNGKFHFNKKYKPGKKLDVYQPTKKAYDKSPVVIFLHGGGWVMGSKFFINNARFHGALNALRDKGYAIISPKYTLAKKGKSPFPACLEDAHDVLAWIKNNADKYNFDLGNVGLLGESAGAHIAMMTAYGNREEFSPHSISIQYVVDVYGPAALYRLYRELMPFIESLSARAERFPRRLRDRFNIAENIFGFNPKDEPEKAKTFADKYSPTQVVTPDAPPTLIIHGDRDPLVPVSQPYILQKKLEEIQVEHEIHIVEKMGHALRGATPMQRGLVQKWIVDFVVGHYNDGGSLK